MSKDEKAKGLEMIAMNKKQAADERAAEWVATLLSGDHRDNTDDALETWRREDDANAKAFDELMGLTRTLETAGEQALEEEWVRELETAADDRKRQRWIAGVSSLAAGFVVAAVMTASMLIGGPEPMTYETVKGQRSTIALEDGSVMQLNTDTRVVALLEDNQRQITIERGEAFFDVKRDESRPFVVQAGKSQVKVLGTEFNVRLGASSNVISVLSGLVSVAHRSDEMHAREVALLHAGEQAEHIASRNEAVVEAFDENAILAWRTGKASYMAKPLHDVVQDLNRYFDAPLEIVDADLADLPVTGTFNLTDQNVVIDALESAFSIMAVKRVDGVILLYARET